MGRSWGKVGHTLEEGKIKREWAGKEKKGLGRLGLTLQI
jgi:hypothetical protein